MGLPFILTIISNTVLPCLAFYQQKNKMGEVVDVINFYEDLQYEKNSIIDQFIELKIPVKTRLDSQSLIFLKKNYCDEKRCIDCAVGLYWLKKSNEEKE